MNVCFKGYGENVVTFEIDGSITDGAPVMVSDSGKVKAASGAFCGVCVSQRGGYAAVQLNGYAKLPYGTAPSVGYAKLSASAGKVNKDDTNGREYLVVDINTTDKTVGVIL